MRGTVAGARRGAPGDSALCLRLRAAATARNSAPRPIMASDRGFRHGRDRRHRRSAATGCRPAVGAAGRRRRRRARICVESCRDGGGAGGRRRAGDRRRAGGGVGAGGVAAGGAGGRRSRPEASRPAASRRGGRSGRLGATADAAVAGRRQRCPWCRGRRGHAAAATATAVAAGRGAAGGLGGGCGADRAGHAGATVVAAALGVSFWATMKLPGGMPPAAGSPNLNRSSSDLVAVGAAGRAAGVLAARRRLPAAAATDEVEWFWLPSPSWATWVPDGAARGRDDRLVLAALEVGQESAAKTLPVHGHVGGGGGTEERDERQNDCAFAFGLEHDGSDVRAGYAHVTVQQSCFRPDQRAGNAPVEVNVN